MGNFTSRKGRRSASKNKKKQPTAPPVLPRDSEDKMLSYDEEALRRMRAQLSQDEDMFLLNNLLMSVQFFGNFEREISRIRNTPVYDREAAINSKLSRHNKHVLIPDRLHETVHKRVRFQERHGPNKSREGALHPLRLLVVHDDVEVTEEGDAADYSVLAQDTPFYRVAVDTAPKEGFVQLRQIEVIEKKQKTSSTRQRYISPTSNDSSSSDSEEGHVDGKSLLENLDKKVKSNLRKVSRNPKIAITLTLKPSDNTTSNNFKNNYSPRLNGSANHYGEDSDDSYTDGENSPKENRKRVSFQTSQTSSNVFGPKSPELDKDSSFTPTERRLSGKTKQSRLNIDNSNDVNMPVNVINHLTADHIFAPQSPDREKDAVFTFTERRLSGTKKNNQVPSNYKPNANKPRNPKEPPPNVSNGTIQPGSSSESDYGYTTIKEITTPKRLKDMRKGDIPSNSTAIPKDCVTEVKVKVKEDKEMEPNYETSITKNNRRNNAKQKVILYETRHYLNSIAFMAHFGDVFSVHLAYPLGFSIEAVSKATMQTSIIYCQVKDGSGSIEYEVIPTVGAAWPDAAYEWVLRQRNAIRDPRNPNLVYQWPNRHMVSKIHNLGCQIIPIGFLPTRGLNVNRGLEWRLAFPAAERYLETCLTHAQIRCYMFTLMLYKSFIEQGGARLGMAAEHIRTQLFWQCEHNYAAWPEDKLGETLLKFLRNFYHNIQKGILPDYFIKDRNLFESTPQITLSQAQHQLYRIIETPVMHVLSAMRNLKYTDDNFYPKLDYKKLYAILTTENILGIINPQLKEPATELYPKELDSDSEEEFEKTGTFWEAIVKKKNPERDWRQKAFKQIQDEKAEAIRAQAKRVSRDSINVKIRIVHPMESMRRRLLFELFISHFIKMAERSNDFDSPRQGLIYTGQAERLNILLGEEPSGETEARKFRPILRHLKEQLNKAVANEEIPKVPHRNDIKRSEINVNARPVHKDVYVNLDSIARESEVTKNETIKKSWGDDVSKENNQKKIIATVQVHNSSEFEDKTITNFNGLKNKPITNSNELKEKQITNSSRLKDKPTINSNGLKEKPITNSSRLKDKPTINSNGLKEKPITNSNRFEDEAITKSNESEDKPIAQREIPLVVKRKQVEDLSTDL